MTREQIINDIKFRQRCGAYGLDWESCVVFDDVILLLSPIKRLYVLFDKNYNTICIDTSPIFDIERFAKEKYYEYSNSLGGKPYEGGFDYPFEKFTLKHIIDLSNRVEIMENNHGHTLCTRVNGDWYDRNNGKSDEEFQLLSYIKFLGEEIKLYFLNYYHMQVLGFEVPNVYEYVKTLMARLNDRVEYHLNHDRRPLPSDILSDLGQNYRELNMDGMLYDVADILMNQKGYKVKSGSLDEIEMIESSKERKDLSLIAQDLLQILELSDEELKIKEQRDREKLVERQLDNLRPYLEEDIDDDFIEEKGPVLTKRKK